VGKGVLHLKPDFGKFLRRERIKNATFVALVRDIESNLNSMYPKS